MQNELDKSSLSDEQLLREYYSRYGGYWECPGLLDFCYLVNPYFTRSKIIDEMQANFRVLVSEYPAGMAVNSRLASQCWNVRPEYILPGNGAAELIKALMTPSKAVSVSFAPRSRNIPTALLPNGWSPSCRSTLCFATMPTI